MTLIGFTVVCIGIIPYNFVYFFRENETTEKLGTYIICLHAFIGVILVFALNSYLQGLANDKSTAIDRIEFLRG